MRAMSDINLTWLEKNKPLLINLSKLNEEDIRKIYIEEHEKQEHSDVDLTKIVYDFRHPLFYKMIFRLRNCGGSAAKFHRQVDPHNQYLLVNYFKLNDILDKNGQLLEFFAWIGNSLGLHDICLLEFNAYSKELCKKSTYSTKWKANEIDFFFNVLPVEKQESLIVRYNKECVASYNTMVNARNNSDDENENSDDVIIISTSPF